MRGLIQWANWANEEARRRNWNETRSEKGKDLKEHENLKIGDAKLEQEQSRSRSRAGAGEQTERTRLQGSHTPLSSFNTTGILGPRPFN